MAERNPYPLVSHSANQIHRQILSPACNTLPANHNLIQEQTANHNWFTGENWKDNYTVGRGGAGERQEEEEDGISRCLKIEMRLGSKRYQGRLPPACRTVMLTVVFVCLCDGIPLLVRLPIIHKGFSVARHEEPSRLRQ